MMRIEITLSGDLSSEEIAEFQRELSLFNKKIKHLIKNIVFKSNKKEHKRYVGVAVADFIAKKKDEK
jgi:hypothetical protein